MVFHCDAAGTGGSPIVWEEVACPVCGAAEEEPLLAVPAEADRAVYRVVRCRACGMGYMNPRPDPASIGQFYAETYECYQAPPSASPAGWWHRTRHRLERWVWSYYYGDPPALAHGYQKLLAALAAPWLRVGRDSLTALAFRGEGRLLDFGSGSGWYAHRMQKRGWIVTGMDFTEHAARRVTERYGIPTLVGTLPHPQVKPASFDVITMGCVLEHVHEPHQVIAAAAQALRPGGLLVIVVPNLDSWGFRYFGRDWWPLELPRHLLHFTPPPLRRLVEAAGLEVCEQRMLSRPGWMRRSFAAARRRPEDSPGRRLLAKCSRLRLLPSTLTQWTVWTQQADCIQLIARRPVRAMGSEPGFASRAA